MTRTRILWLLASLSVAGCGMLHRKDAEAPTQVALSLYAAPDVNPNADALAPDTSAPAAQTPDMAAVTVDTSAKEGPYLVNLTGSSKSELAEKMRALLDYLQAPEQGKPAPQIALQVTPPATPAVTANHATPVPAAASATGQSGSSPNLATTVAAGAVGAVATTAVTTAVAPHASTTGKAVLGVAGGAAGAWAGSALQARSTAGQSDAAAPPAAVPASAETPMPVPVVSSVPVPLHAGNDNRSASAAVKTPALGQYADGPAGLSIPGSAMDGRSVATPIAFKILQLKDDSVFLNADPELLLKDLKKTLGSTYIDDNDYVLQPGQFKYIEFKKIDKNTRFLAVLANFHDQTQAQGKQVMRVEAGGYKYALLVIFRQLEVGMVDESYHQPPRTKS